MIEMFLLLPMLLIIIATSLYWLWMLIDAIQFQKKDQALWIIVILLGHFLGAIIYHVVEKSKRKPNKKGSK